MIQELDPAAPHELPAPPPSGGPLGPYEVSYDIRRGYDEPPPPSASRPRRTRDRAAERWSADGPRR